MKCRIVPAARRRRAVAARPPARRRTRTGAMCSVIETGGTRYSPAPAQKTRDALAQAATTDRENSEPSGKGAGEYLASPSR